MAERRMFAKTIIDSDAFLDMPLSTQALYFHLSMRGDDDGFINNPKKIQRMIGASEDDLKLLIAKNFIIPFESGIVVIKHWKIHNYIRGDRKKETVYPDEMALLETKENGAYTLLANLPAVECISGSSETARQKAYKESSLPYSFEYKIRQAFTGRICPICGAVMQRDFEDGIETRNRIPTIQHNIPISKGGKHELGNISVICKECNIKLQDTETDELNASEVIEEWDRICATSQVPDKCLTSAYQVTAQDRIGKDSIGKVRIDKDRIDYKGIIDAYNSLCPSLPSVKSLSETRKKAIKARLKTYGVDELKEVFLKAEASDFLKGKNDRNWQANFDWIMKDSNIAKILDGNYDNRQAKSQNRAAENLQASYDMMKEWSGA